jgi:prepilin peptidase CpaA
MIIEILLVGLVTAAAITDLASRRIPNVLIAAGLVASLMVQTFSPAGLGWAAWLLGMLTGFVLLLPVYLLRGMGAGDVKLMAAIGAFVGPFIALKIVLATFLIGGIWSLAVILFKGKWNEVWINIRTLLQPVLARMEKIPVGTAGMPVQSVGRLPYGVAIAMATLIILFLDR